MNEQSPEEVSEEVIITSSTNKEEETKETTDMQTTEIVDNSENGDVTIVKSTTDSTSENVPPTQIEDEDNMSDIPGIRVSMATIVELPPLEEQQRLSDENAPAVSEKVIDEIFSSIITLPEEQQIKSSEVPNQQEPQSTVLTEMSVTNETSDVPPATDATNETNEDSEDNTSNEVNEEIETILTSETVITEIAERPVEDSTENINKTDEIVQNNQNSQNSSVVQDVENIQNSSNSSVIQDAQSVQNMQSTQNIQNTPIVHDVQSVQVAQNDQSSPIMQNVKDIQNPQEIPVKVEDVRNDPTVQNTQNQKDQNVENSQSIQSTQQPMIIDQDISQQPPEQKSEQVVDDKTVQPIVSGSTEPMDTLNTSSDDYKNVPPPSTLTTPTGTFDYEDAIKKAHAIAAKLLNNNESAQQGVKRSHEDSYNSHGSTRDSRDDYRDDYRRDSYNRRERGRYDDYGRDSKRAAYDSGSSRSEERRSHHGSHYGPGDSRATGHEEFKVPNAVVGLVIGRGGENLKRIEKNTGARIQFSQDQPPDVIERRVTITGQVDDVKTARAMIQQLVEDASNGTLTGRRDSHGSGSNRATITIHIPVNKVGVVIGRGGETIRDLQDRSGARINVTPDSAASPQSNDRSVTLIGDDAAVQRAKALIDEIVNNGETSSDRNHSKEYRSSNYGNNYNNNDSHHGSSYGGSHYGSSNHGGQYGSHHSGKSNQNQDSITIQVPNDSVGLIIGKGGETVRALQQQSGAKIQIEPVHGATPVDRNVQIIGTAENIAIAKSLILEKAASGNRERPSRHNNDQGRNDYGSSGYQQSGYQQGSGYQQSGYQQSSYRQGTYQPNNYQQGGGGYPQNSGYQQSGVSNSNVTNSNTPGYQQTGYPTNTYNPAPQQQTTYQNTSNDYVQNATSSYPSANTYGVTGQQPQTAYGQYNQYGTTQNTTPYSQYPTTQYGAYGQPTQYNQPTAGQVGQPTVQPTVQPVIQPVIQAVGNQPTGQPTQVGYYSTQQTTMDPTKVGSVNEIKQDPQPITATPNYSYQFPYNYGTPSSNQYPSVGAGQIQTATVSQAASGYPILGATATAYSSPATLNTGTTANTAPPGISGLPTTLIAELKRGLTIIGIGHLTAIITCIRRGKCIIYTQGVHCTTSLTLILMHTLCKV
ncbi:17274_t:CDS:10 [Rhizophagus irregularis]|nr:17274_t:CDS:10 [Rhizophagus irregularis]